MPVLTRILAVLLQPALFTLLLFAPAASFAWWRAWVLVGIVLVGSAASFGTLARESPDLLAERLQGPLQQGQPWADRLILLAYLATFASVVAFIPEDVFRLRVFAPPPPIVSAIGLGLFVAGWVLATMALRTNAFAAPVVKHMAARGQAVVDTGVYAIVRHPMYAGVVLLLLGMPLWLESYAALLAAMVPIALLVVRILIEERYLCGALPGYAPYTERVRHRLVPGLW